MGLFDWLDEQIEKMRWYDISLIKLSVFFFTLFLVVAWADFRVFVLGFAWYWYLALFVVVSLPLYKKIFFD